MLPVHSREIIQRQHGCFFFHQALHGLWVLGLVPLHAADKGLVIGLESRPSRCHAGPFSASAEPPPSVPCSARSPACVPSNSDVRLRPFFTHGFPEPQGTISGSQFGWNRQPLALQMLQHFQPTALRLPIAIHDGQHLFVPCIIRADDTNKRSLSSILTLL